MASKDDHSHHLNTQDARQGKEMGSVRWVLRVSLGLDGTHDVVDADPGHTGGLEPDVR